MFRPVRLNFHGIYILYQPHRLKCFIQKGRYSEKHSHVHLKINIIKKESLSNRNYPYMNELPT